MKALTLHQPWASLIAAGVKSIETRPWSTKYRGPLVIHAGQTLGAGAVGGWDVFEAADRTWVAEHRTHRQTTSLALPRGAIVASCELVDVVPIIDPAACQWHNEHPRGVAACVHAAVDEQVIVHTPEAPTHTTVLVEAAYGDYTPGRFAWLLADIRSTAERCPACWGKGWHDRRHLGPGSSTEPAGCGFCSSLDPGTCEPIPARGKQGLWDWEVAA